ncbi:GLPGLI family protein, partial [Kaistella sp.]|uniref:GLPGLI family protein n=1 Tax=Kaistella sp. TaxID=2782235 RepID=UPI003C50453E
MNKFLILILFCTLIKSQNNKSTVDIEYTLNKHKNGYSFVADASLLIDKVNQTSLFQLKKIIDMSPKLESDEAVNFSTRTICEDEKKYYFNFKNKTFTGLLYDVSCDNKVLIQNKISLPKWKITNKYRSINGKKARLAIANICGRQWLAYYLENNLNNFGPWKIIGLNGLVILA